MIHIQYMREDDHLNNITFFNRINSAPYPAYHTHAHTHLMITSPNSACNRLLSFFFFWLLLFWPFSLLSQRRFFICASSWQVWDTNGLLSQLWRCTCRRWGSHILFSEENFVPPPPKELLLRHFWMALCSSGTFYLPLHSAMVFYSPRPI